MIFPCSCQIINNNLNQASSFLHFKMILYFTIYKILRVKESEEIKDILDLGCAELDDELELYQQVLLLDSVLLNKYLSLCQGHRLDHVHFQWSLLRRKLVRHISSRLIRKEWTLGQGIRSLVRIEWPSDSRWFKKRNVFYNQYILSIATVGLPIDCKILYKVLVLSKEFYNWKFFIFKTLYTFTSAIRDLKLIGGNTS